MQALPKKVVLSIFIVAAFLSVAPAASAVSLQVRGGLSRGDAGGGMDIGLELFFYEGRSFDFYIGYDIISASQRYSVITTTGVVDATTDSTITAVIYGVRYKMQTESSWKPYVSFGFTRLNTKFTHQPGMEPYFEQPYEKSTSGILLGLGVNVGISDKWSVGLEGGMLTDVPYYETSYLGFGGSRLSLTDYGTISQVDVALRYHFD